MNANVPNVEMAFTQAGRGMGNEESMFGVTYSHLSE